jgi:hypothetical protein
MVETFQAGPAHLQPTLEIPPKPTNNRSFEGLKRNPRPGNRSMGSTAPTHFFSAVSDPQIKITRPGEPPLKRREQVLSFLVIFKNSDGLSVVRRP